MGRELRGIKGRDAINAFLRAGGIERPGKGDHINIKLPNGMIITVPDKRELKIGLLKVQFIRQVSPRNSFSIYSDKYSKS